MLKYENGQYLEMTPEEIAAIQQQEQEERQPSLEERVALIEALLTEKGLM